MSENEVIYWSPHFQLQSSHFQGIPDEQNHSAANSNTNMQYQFSNEVKETKSKYKIKINKIDVFSFFNTKKSWLQRRDVTEEQNLHILLKYSNNNFVKITSQKNPKNSYNHQRNYKHRIYANYQF